MTLPRLIHLDYYFKIVHKVRENIYEMRTHKGECVFEMDADTMSAIVYKHIPGAKKGYWTNDGAAYLAASNMDSLFFKCKVAATSRGWDANRLMQFIYIFEQ